MALQVVVCVFFLDSGINSSEFYGKPLKSALSNK